ncbi:hypothetical protein KIPB_010919, partial [Kipferlia bialata]
PPSLSPSLTCRFMKCTAAQLKELCKAAGIKVSGAKGELAERLKKEGLSGTGNRYDLVLRLVQLATGNGEPKKARGTRNEAGEFVPKKRGPSMAIPDAAKLLARVEKLAYPGDKVVFSWSNYKSKYHLDRVLGLCCELFERHVLVKNLIERDHLELAWTIVNDLNGVWGLCGNGIRGWGYISVDGTLDMWIDKMEALCNRTQAYLATHPEKQGWWQGHTEEAESILRKIHRELPQYGMEPDAKELQNKVLQHPVWGHPTPESSTEEEGVEAEERGRAEGAPAEGEVLTGAAALAVCMPSYTGDPDLMNATVYPDGTFFVSRK